MRTIFNWVALGVVSLGLVLALTLGAARMVSEPSLGERLAQRHGVPHPAVIAHRGASYLAPEATRPAFLLAREQGADFLDLDVQRTQDGVLIVLHDADLRRTTDVEKVFPGREADPVDRFTFAELQQLDAGSWFNDAFPERAREAFRGLRILRVEEVIDIAEGGSPPPGLYIETKRPGQFPGIERQLVDTLRRRGWIQPPSGNQTNAAQAPMGADLPARLMFQSFSPESLAQLKTLAPQVPAVLLIHERMIHALGWEGVLTTARQVAVGIGTWGSRRASSRDWSVEHSPERYLATWPWYTGQAHRAGLLVHPWTIDDPWEMWMLRLCGADGLFTNRPSLALEVFGRAHSHDLESLWQEIGY